MNPHQDFLGDILPLGVNGALSGVAKGSSLGAAEVGGVVAATGDAAPEEGRGDDRSFTFVLSSIFLWRRMSSIILSNRATRFVLRGFADPKATRALFYKTTSHLTCDSIKHKV